MSGDWLGPDVREGTAHLYKAEREGSADAALALGHFYIRAKNKPHAIEQLSLATRMGSAMAEYELAKLLLFDADLTDWQKAADHLATSARMGNAYAHKALCRMAEDPLLRAATSAAALAAEAEPLFRDDTAGGEPTHRKQTERYR